MADQAAEGEGYSDEDLDALPVNTFQKLQQDALISTQQSRRDVPHILSRPQGKVSTDVADDLILDAPTQSKSPLQPSSDYGDFDDEMLDGEIFDGTQRPDIAHRPQPAISVGESTQRERWRRQRYSAISQTGAYQAEQFYPTRINGQILTVTSPKNKDNVTSPAPAQPLDEKITTLLSADEDSMQTEIQRLLDEREALKRAVSSAQDSSIVKAGEIAMVREKIAKAEQEFEHRTKVQQRLHADESAKYRVEIEKARSEIQSITTERAFLENELLEGSKQLRQAQRGVKNGASVWSAASGGSKDNLLATPRKSRNMSFADGFNDDEIQVLSPSKLALRRKTGTPKAGVKRKRKPTDESPTKTQELELVESVKQDKGQREAASRLIAGKQTQRQRDADLQFIQRLLNHKFEQSQERAIEALSRFNLPSRPEKALSTLLYDELLMLGETAKVKNLPVAVGLIVISLWSRCLEERFYSPLHLLIDLLEFIILTTPLKTAPELTDSLMGLVQETADIIIIPRCQKKPPPRHESCRITSSACLRIIQMVAQDCSIDAEEISRFWRTMRFDFTMMLLSFLHPLDELHIAVAVLRTSVLKNSFAMIIPLGDGKQNISEAHVIDNLSRLLVESPRLTQGEFILDAVQLCDLRIEILGLLDAMCDSEYCAEALAKHRFVIGRLVRVMNDELDRSYDHRYGHHQRITLVNAATHLLYFLMSKYAPLIDLQARLSVIPGGEKKLLIVLTRLAFSEGSFLEGGIQDEVVDKAHQLLEMRVSPEEADQLVSAFASTQSAKLVSKDSV